MEVVLIWDEGMRLCHQHVGCMAVMVVAVVDVVVPLASGHNGGCGHCHHCVPGKVVVGLPCAASWMAVVAMLL